MRWVVCAYLLVATVGRADAAPANYEQSVEMRAAGDAWDRGDKVSAIPSFMAAAAKGDSGAQMVLGSLYEIGQGVPKDFARARQYLLLASNAGWGEAMNNLGVMIWRGEGAAPDHVEGMKWLVLAVRNMSVRHDESSTPLGTPQSNIEKYRAMMSAAEIAEAEKRADAWKSPQTSQ